MPHDNPILTQKFRWLPHDISLRELRAILALVKHEAAHPVRLRRAQGLLVRLQTPQGAHAILTVNN